MAHKGNASFCIAGATGNINLLERIMATGKAIKFTCIDDDLEYTLARFAAKHGKSIHGMRHRYYKLGRPERLTVADLIAPLQHGGQNALAITLVRADGTRELLSMAEIARECNRATGRRQPDSTFSKRWVTMGCPHIVNIEQFTKPTAAFCEDQRRFNGRAETDLSHIPQGDLESLSDRENTGAAREEAHLWQCPGSLSDRGRFNGFVNRGGQSVPVYA